VLGVALRDYLTSEVVTDCADGLLTRREAVRRLGLLGVGLSAAGGLLAACGDDDGEGASPDTTATTAAPSTASTATADEDGEITFEGPSGEIRAAFATTPDPSAGVLVVHENRGLTPHFRDLVGRLAAEEYAALCVDLLSAEGGTDALPDPGGAPAALAAAPLDRLLGDLRAGLDELGRRVPRAPLGAVGFCFGGAMVWSLLDAGEDRLAAAVPFYGPAPEAPDFSGVETAVLGIYAELDARVNASRGRAEAALQQAGLVHEIRTFPGVDHAFFNDTGPRYDEAAASEAYDALVDWFGRYLQ
jgi:carboxymethylenebutenolidase